jgi:hypothetical protein
VIIGHCARHPHVRSTMPHCRSKLRRCPTIRMDGKVCCTSVKGRWTSTSPRRSCCTFLLVPLEPYIWIFVRDPTLDTALACDSIFRQRPDVMENFQNFRTNFVATRKMCNLGWKLKATEGYSFQLHLQESYPLM